MLLRIGQAATYLGVSPDTVRRWIDGGRLQAVRLPTTGERRVQEQDVREMKAQMESLGRQAGADVSEE